MSKIVVLGVLTIWKCNNNIIHLNVFKSLDEKKKKKEYVEKKENMKKERKKTKKIEV